MKKEISAIIVFLSCLISAEIRGNNYYFSSSIGNDLNTAIQAQSPTTPWKTLSKLNAIMNILLPGDSVLFKNGDTFYGSFTVTVSGSAIAPIVFSSYGIGAKPIITGLTAITTWSAQGANIWMADCDSCDNQLNMLLINDSVKAIGRYPNYSDPNNGYLNFEAHTINSITDNQLGTTPDWSGAELAIRSQRWIIDRLPIQQHAGTTLTFSGSVTSNTLYDNWGYFIQKHPSTLDQHGEWYYDSHSKQILLYSNTTPNSSFIYGATLDNFVTCINQNYIQINNLTFKGSNSSAMNFNNCNFIKISNTDIICSGVNAFYGYLLNNFIFENNRINYTNNNVIRIDAGNNNQIINNVIKNTGTLPGMGQFDGYSGLSILGNNNTILNNIIDSTGYNPIAFNGDTILIKNNVITNFCFVKDDGGGIYTWNYCSATPVGIYGIPHTNRKIEGNIVLNGMGATYGTDNTYPLVWGIYLDDNSMDVEIKDNSVANCANAGIFLHNAYSNTVTGNTSFNNNITQLFFEAGGWCSSDTMVNNTIKNNILFSKQATQLVSFLRAYNPNNPVKRFGKFDSNYYCRPVNEDDIVKLINVPDVTTKNLPEWQTYYSNDPNSHITPIQITSYSVNSYVGSNKFSNEMFSNDITGPYFFCSQSNCNASWDAVSPLDTGALMFSVSNTTTLTNNAFLFLDVGAFDLAKKYILKFSLKGTKNQKMIIRLKQAGWPYSSATAEQFCKITTNRTEHEFLFMPSFSDNTGLIEFDISNFDSTMWIDNVEFYEVNATLADLDNNIRFEYNPTQLPKVINLLDTYIDVKSNNYSGSLVLQPFSSIILLKAPNILTSDIVSDELYVSRALVNIYPNPTSTLLNFNSTSTEFRKIDIYDVTGRMIASYPYSKQIDVSTINNGIYFIKVNTKNDERSTTKKIIIQR